MSDTRAIAVGDEDLLEGEPFYIHTQATPADERDLVLKQNDTFAVFDRYGDIRPVGLAEEGLYHGGTRYLSTLAVRLARQRPLLLSSAVRGDNAWLTVDLTNADIASHGVITLPRGLLHLSRQLVLLDGVLHEQFTVRNYGLVPVALPLAVRFAADYADIFEVRGTHRARRGERLPAVVERAGVVLGYRGLDDRVRRTRIAIDPAPRRLEDGLAVFECQLPPQAEQTVLLTFSCDDDAPRRPTTFSRAVDTVSASLRARRDGNCDITTSNQQFNRWLDRSFADLAMMISDTPHGQYPYAGVPWFSTPFGRDGLITAFECLWVNPDIARGVLRYLAATQATRAEASMDAQPGKILHETRSGEMAALGEIPFGRYYGSHDATPLFVMLAAAYYRVTGDRDLIVELWPAILAALEWIDRDGDLDGDGFVEYARQTPSGLVHQGWKDSHDSVSHRDGTLAEGPIALCEIQGYVYAAWRGMALLSSVTGHGADVHRWTGKAGALRARFEERFWLPELGTYALALDGAKRPCAVRSSNAGHALFTGIAGPDRADKVAEALIAPDSFSGWGLRTLATTEARYNPMSYHNGSVWPHDNALVAAGLSRYRRHDETLAVLSGLFEASLSFDFHRLPELFCGFPRREGEGPVSYPVACNPQAWASASVFLLLQAALGLEVEGPERIVRFTRARLPEFLDDVWIRNLRVGPYGLDLRLERHAEDVGITVLRREGNVEIIGIK
jgi:glycogen debranching enzyme